MTNCSFLVRTASYKVPTGLKSAIEPGIPRKYPYARMTRDDQYPSSGGVKFLERDGQTRTAVRNTDKVLSCRMPSSSRSKLAARRLIQPIDDLFFDADRLRSIHAPSCHPLTPERITPTVSLLHSGVADNSTIFIYLGRTIYLLLHHPPRPVLSDAAKDPRRSKFGTSNRPSQLTHGFLSPRSDDKHVVTLRGEG